MNNHRFDHWQQAGYIALVAIAAILLIYFVGHRLI